MGIPIPGKAGFAEDQLLTQAREGSADAFCALIEPLQPRLLRQASMLCGEQSMAQDLVQQTLVEAWRSLDRFNGSCRLTTWLYAILLHRHQKSIRAAAIRPVPLARLPAVQARDGQEWLASQAGSEMPPDLALRKADQAHSIRQLVLTLSPPHRHVIMLRFFEEATLAEIAAVMGTSVGTVKSRLHHALEKLRRLNLKQFSGDT